jgi:hypothetical protein
MLVHGLDEAPQTQVYNEGDRKAFREFRLRPLDAIDSLVEASAADFVLFKPLCDSHRALELLEHFRPNGRVIWAYRDMDERVRSALAKFGDSNLRALRAFAIGEGAVGWQVQGLSAENADLIKSFDFDRLSAESGAALFWYVRNSLYFEMSLDMRQDAILASYDQILADPERIVGALCSFLGLPYRPEIVAHVKRRRRPPNSPLAIDPGIRERCAELQERLDALSRYQIASLEARTP